MTFCVSPGCLKMTKVPKPIFDFQRFELFGIIGYLDFSNIQNFSSTCRYVFKKSQMYLDKYPLDKVLITTDTLLSQGKIVMAEHFIRRFVARDTTFKIVNRYLMIINEYIWNRKKYSQTRKNIYSYFKVKLLDAFHPAKFIPYELYRANNVDSIVPIFKSSQSISRREAETLDISDDCTDISCIPNSNAYPKIKQSPKTILKTTICIFAYICIKDTRTKLGYELMEYVSDHNHPLRYLIGLEPSVCKYIKGLSCGKKCCKKYCNTKFRERFKSLKQCIAMFPNFAGGYHEMAMFLFNRYPSVTNALLNKCIELDPNHLPSLLNKANLIPLVDENAKVEKEKLFGRAYWSNPEHLVATSYFVMYRLSINRITFDNGEQIIQQLCIKDSDKEFIYYTYYIMGIFYICYKINYELACQWFGKFTKICAKLYPKESARITTNIQELLGDLVDRMNSNSAAD